MRKLKKSEERAGQYATRETARRQAVHNVYRTGLAFKPVKTTTYRDGEPVECWTITCTV